MTERQFPPFPLDVLVSLGFGAVLLTAAAVLTWGPPAQAFRDSGWFYPAWGFALLMNLAAWRGLGVLWRWLVFRPDPPLTWREWFDSFRTRRALGFTLGGLAALLPGLVLTKAMSIDPWWHWWQAQGWPQATCTIVEGSLYTTRGSASFSRRRTYMHLAFAFERDGRRHVVQTYSPWRVGGTEWRIGPPREIVAGEPVDLDPRFPLGSVHRCVVAPDGAPRAYLDRQRWSGGLAIAAIGPAFCLFGLLLLSARPRGAAAA